MTIISSFTQSGWVEHLRHSLAFTIGNETTHAYHKLQPSATFVHEEVHYIMECIAFGQMVETCLRLLGEISPSIPSIKRAMSLLSSCCVLVESQ
mmetsp:Transcript_10776/g.25508  ORF Transcript_10776/g.25508 Transcript_10776/m.25508 type:complete len:94 (+) Transcript_10776:184-465(+)